MSGYKSHELVAIYRLEFYKKQKHWKFSNDTKKIPRKTTKAKKVLNTTYNIDTTSVTEHPAPLSQGFREETVDKSASALAHLNIPANSPTHVVEECDQTWPQGDQIGPKDDQTCPQYDQIWPQNGLIWPQDDQIWSYNDHIWRQSYQGWPEDDQGCYEEPEWQEAMLPQQCERGAGEAGWRSVAGLARPPELLISHSVLPQVRIIEAERDAEVMQLAQHWDEPHQPSSDHSPMWTQRDTWGSGRAVGAVGAAGVAGAVGAAGAEGPRCGFAQFALGAHAAPHSSELDLRLPLLHHSEGEAAPPPPAPPSPPALSARQLAAAVREHSRALAALLHETVLRNNRVLSPPATQPLPPGPPGLPGHAAGAGFGRGRGRLRDNQPIIGIGMGRPYRM